MINVPAETVRGPPAQGLNGLGRGTTASGPGGAPLAEGVAGIC